MKQKINPKIKEKYDIKDEKSIYTLIFDMNSVMKMSISADKRIGTNGLQYGMVFQTLVQFKKMLQYKDFDYVYAFYDGEQSGILRYELYEDYKANRDKNYKSNLTDYDKFINDYCKRVIEYSNSKKKSLKEAKNEPNEETEDESFERQREIIFNILEELFVRQEIAPKIEGDDLIAYYVNNKKNNEKIVIYSGDRDLTQLIADDVTVYVPQIKRFVTPKNHSELIGFYYENVVLKKIICGDASDNIKGIKGVGETLLMKTFPKIKTEKVTLEDIINESIRINEERKKNKKKELKTLNNIINSITDGKQGKRIYEINEKIISLKNPLLTMEAIEEMDNLRYAPIDPSDRNFKNVYEIISKNGMSELLDENKFSTFFSSFNPLIEKEKKRFKEMES